MVVQGAEGTDLSVTGARQGIWVGPEPRAVFWLLWFLLLSHSVPRSGALCVSAAQEDQQVLTRVPWEPVMCKCVWAIVLCYQVLERDY